MKSLGKIIENIFTILLGQEYSSLEIHATTKGKIRQTQLLIITNAYKVKVTISQI